MTTSKIGLNLFDSLFQGDREAPMCEYFFEKMLKYHDDVFYRYWSDDAENQCDDMLLLLEAVLSTDTGKDTK